MSWRLFFLGTTKDILHDEFYQNGKGELALKMLKASADDSSGVQLMPQN
jgi:hypothetical protein